MIASLNDSPGKRRTYTRISNQQKAQLLNLFFYENYSMKKVWSCFIHVLILTLGIEENGNKLFNGQNDSIRVSEKVTK